MGQRLGDEWLTAGQVAREFGFSKSFVYGRLKKLVTARRVPGETLKYLRADVERLSRQYTTAPEQPAPAPVAAYWQHGRRVHPRPPVQYPRFLSLMN